MTSARSTPGICFVRSNVLKSKAEHQIAAKEYLEARSTYTSAAIEMVGLAWLGRRPLGDFERLGQGWDAIVECSRKLKLKDHDSTLLWLEEADVLDKNIEFASNLRSGLVMSYPGGRNIHALPEWTPTTVTWVDYCFERIPSLYLASDISLIGNTGSAVHRRWLAQEIFAVLPESLKTAQTLKLTPLLGSDLLGLRHPDPKLAPSLTTERPDHGTTGRLVTAAIFPAAERNYCLHSGLPDYSAYRDGSSNENNNNQSATPLKRKQTSVILLGTRNDSENFEYILEQGEWDWPSPIISHPVPFLMVRRVGLAVKKGTPSGKIALTIACDVVMIARSSGSSIAIPKRGRKAKDIIAKLLEQNSQSSSPSPPIQAHLAESRGGNCRNRSRGYKQ
ncbi:hypothetical protein DFH07DRAFT_1016736 [Mycena maculata]|uniref:Uncharacterized protein n=1 Tax=Mycena maculata TaxID=230809 RepID=A0AAD7NJ34_9AGAR|nr:hypothetical protein DFH07DRAFT_1016736 [Mycena maculata]